MLGSNLTAVSFPVPTTDPRPLILPEAHIFSPPASFLTIASSAPRPEHMHQWLACLSSPENGCSLLQLLPREPDISETSFSMPPLPVVTSTAATTARMTFKTCCKLVADLSYTSLVINPQANQQHCKWGPSTSKATLSCLESVPAVNEADKAC